MKLIIQRVSQAKVIVDNLNVGEIQKGFLIYVCFTKDDSKKQISDAATKVLNLRIFEDDNGKMNKNILQTKAEILSIKHKLLKANCCFRRNDKLIFIGSF